MKIKHMLLFGIVVAFGSCSTAYRSGQTPDDVYYSPAPVQSSYVNTVTDKDRNSYSYRNDEDAAIRRGIQDPAYRTPITLDLGYGYSPYDYGSFGYSPYSNPYSFGNSLYGYNSYGMYNPYMNMGMYNPYMYNSFGYGGLGYYNPYSFYSPFNMYSSSYYGHYYSSYYYPATNVNTNRGARRYNLNPYNNNNTQPANTGSVGVRSGVQPNTSTPSAPVRRTSGVGNVIRRVFTPSNNNTYNPPTNNNRIYNNSNNNTNNNSAPVRSFDNSPSVSTPSSSGNSSAPVRTFRR